tara:strand:- start:644 stop:799 length:156 start_codon:yes stop_codon:yes gene_type:complete
MEDKFLTFAKNMFYKNTTERQALMEKPYESFEDYFSANRIFLQEQYKKNFN